MKNEILLLSPKIDLIKTNKGAILKYIGGTNLIFLTHTEAYFLSLCDGTKNIEEIVLNISNLYDVPYNTVENDLTDLINKYLKANIISILPQKLSKRLSRYKKDEFIFIPEIDNPTIIPQKINSIGFSLQIIVL
ncbi:PqqD family protein [Marinitoga sp. 38H-ov]|uniref:PqqD family protein n=1 Tax=Marinitoga sp. 38H-ov TaxID=1755814 RepID=UPI0019D03701|nr:PqqD family protein [Marinitoga sp. 38H-ov]